MLLAWLSTSFQSLSLLPTNKLGPSVADSWVSGFVCILGPCGSLPQTFHVRLGVSPVAAATPIGYFSQKFEALFPFTVTLGCMVMFPSCSSQFFCMQRWDCLLHQLLPCLESSLPRLPISAPPTSMGECFSFNSLVV